ncbi:hypothetical protein G210_3477, partial [Candida maltosa Xu316]
VQQPGDQHSGENGGGEHELSAWDKIRLANGLDVSQSNNQTTSPSTSSAWDELRKSPGFDISVSFLILEGVFDNRLELSRLYGG